MAKVDNKHLQTF